MQTISHTNNNIHPIFTDIENIYTLTSEEHTKKSLILTQYATLLQPLIKVFSEYGKVDYSVNFKEKEYDKIPWKPKQDKILLCFSGGKDSVATALYYKQLDYDVCLYHLKGINQTYKDEYKSAVELAEMLKLPIVVEEVQLKGNHIYVEHPLKNMIIANMATQYIINNHLDYNIGFGNYDTSMLYDNPFEVCAGDCRDMWNIYENIINAITEKTFKILTPLQNIQESFEILSEHTELISHIKSCIGPYRYREYLHRYNQEKYDIELYPHRCGSCWKCCVEYMWLTDHNITTYNEAYYKHCLKRLKDTLKQEQDIIVNLEDVWDYYCFYDKGDSKYFGNK